MATLHEHCNTGDNTHTWLRYTIVWCAQTFTPAITHDIGSVRIKIKATANPGDIYVSIKATDGSGHPTGADLCSVTKPGEDLSTPARWETLVFPTNPTLSSGTKYALILRYILDSPNPATELGLEWREVLDSAYANGNREVSYNNGVDWTTFANHDMMFEEWEGVPMGAFLPQII